MTPAGTVARLRPLPLRDGSRRAPAIRGEASLRPRILVCDAESQSLHALRVVLHGAGFEVDVTRTTAEALDRGALCLPAAAIIELVLADGDGVEVPAAAGVERNAGDRAVGRV